MLAKLSKYYLSGTVASWMYFNHQINKEVRRSLINKEIKKDIDDNLILKVSTVCAIFWPFLLPKHLLGNLDISISNQKY